MISATSREEIERKIDTLLAEGKPYETMPLVLPATGTAMRFDYRGISVREWHAAGNVRFDAAVELTENAGS